MEEKNEGTYMQQDNKMVAYFELGVMSASDGEKIKRIMQGQSAMNFNITVSPVGGTCCVMVAGVEDSVEELKSMFMFCMASELTKI